MQTEQKKIIEIVENIIEEKARNGNTQELEAKINQIVYQLFNLTQEEIEIIENAVK